MKLIRLAAKLRGRTPAELGTRGAQALAAAAERWGISPDVRPLAADRWFLAMLLPSALPDGGDAAAWLEHFRTRETPRFFAPFREREAVLTLLRSRWPQAEAEVVAEAERIREGTFSFLGQEELSFGDPIDWHLDPVAERRGPALHWSRVPFLDAAEVGDHKLVWELNRLQHLLTLGKAYWYTGDERFAEAFVEHVTGWLDANPPKQGINWASSLEVAFRAIAWSWAVYFFGESPRLTPEVFFRICRSLHLHGRHLEKYLSTYFSPNTHLTGEALGLFYLGTVFPELRAAARWRELGLAILVEELQTQVRPDGVYFEQATYYHRYTTDFYLHLLILARANAVPLGASVPARLGQLLDVLMYLTEPAGGTPLLSDDDGGRLLPLDSRAPADFRDTLAVGAACFGRGDLRFVAGAPAEMIVWLLGTEGVRAWDAAEPVEPAAGSIRFPDGGYYVMRDGWGARANYLVADCGPHGMMNCGHAHADALAVEVVAGGAPMLVDPGTFTYTGDVQLRDHFRSSLAHNTLSVDGESSSLPNGPFQWAHVARCSEREWIATERFDFFAGTHDGYQRLHDPATHQRSIFFLKGEYWIVLDRLLAAGEHRTELRFQWAPGVRVSGCGEALLGRDAATGAQLQLAVCGGGDPDHLVAPVSGGHGEITEGSLTVFASSGVGNRDLISVLVPGRRGDPLRDVSVHECGRGRVITIRGDAGEDRCLLGGGGWMQDGLVASDGAWVWMRASEDEVSPREMIALNARGVVWAGEALLNAEQPVRYCAARWHDGRLQAEVDATGVVELYARGARTVRVNGIAVSPDERGCCLVTTKGQARRRSGTLSTRGTD